ncbi:fibronectin type III domain-containing protein [Streptomyces sp. NPDC090108]|uniref:fibronectin type III domain-containing protein n=1 Tax=Streptomyces sp. NPDC090108 TaxID=3365947 RepID=UPI0038296825
MRRALLPLVPSVGAVVLVASCAWGGTADSDSGQSPGAPTGVTAVAGSASSVHVMWNDMATASDIGGYEVYRGTTKVTQVPGAQHMVDVTRLRPSTMYVFTVRARGKDGRLGPPSRGTRARTPAMVAADRSAPTGPGRQTGRVLGSRMVELSWTAARDDRAVVSYDIYQGGTKIHSVGGNQVATVLTGLRPGSRYAFTVRARDAAGNLSPAGTPVRLSTPGTDDGHGTAPTGFTVTAHRSAGTYSIDLAWDPPAVDGTITEYQIQVDDRPATSLVWGGEPPHGRAHYRLYSGSDAGTGQRIRLRARLPDGTWGGFSAERTVPPAAGD